MKDYGFLEPAQIELEEEVKCYNEQQAGLGYDFAKEVSDTIGRILRYPEACFLDTFVYPISSEPP